MVNKVCGYFLDGYVPQLSLAIEIDEKYHKNLEQLKKKIKEEKSI
jgi:hypothetical protein